MFGGGDEHFSSITEMDDGEMGAPNFVFSNPSSSAVDISRPYKPRLRNKHSFKKLAMANIIVGCNDRGKPDARLIVPDEKNPEYVKEYSKSRQSYYCLGCHGTSKKYVIGKIIGNIFYAPILHVKTCVSVLRHEAEERVRKNNERCGRNLSAGGAAAEESAFLKSLEAIHQQSLIRDHQLSSSYASNADDDEMEDDDDVVFLDTSAAPDGEEEDVLSFNQKLSTSLAAGPSRQQNHIKDVPKERTNQREESKGFSYHKQTTNALLNNLFQSKNTSLVRNFLNDEFPVKREESLPLVLQLERPIDIYEFTHPSSTWLKRASQKLGLTYNHSAYCFWSTIRIMQLKEPCKPLDVQTIENGRSSDFRALSFLLSGEEKEEIRRPICKYFFENFKTFGNTGHIDFSRLTLESDIVKETIFADTLTPILWETVAKLLSCRIGIFTKQKLQKYGNWNDTNDDEIITLLFQKENENYFIVKSVREL